MRINRLAVLCAVMGALSANDVWASAIHEQCRDGTINAQRILNSWYQAGVFRDFRQREGSGEIHANTARWETVGEKVQISIGIAAYCFIVDNAGRGVVTVMGSKQERLGSIVNGNWTPN